MARQDINLLSVIDDFPNQKILVLGDAMLDSYLRGTSQRLCQEAPVPIVDIHEMIFGPGGAANAAVNLRSLGAQVTFLSVLGQDHEGSKLLTALQEHRVVVDNVLVSPKRNTLAKQRIVSASQVIVRFDQGSTSPLDVETESKLIKRLHLLFKECSGILVSDYGYGVITPRILQTLEELQAKHPRLVVIDSKRLRLYRKLKPTVIKLNYDETLKLLGLEKVLEHAERLQQIREHGRQVLDITNAQIAAITLDQNGSLIFRDGDEVPYQTYATPVPNSQAAGAGDTFIATLAVSVAAGAAVEQAAEIASAAASIVVSKSGTSACFAEELKDYFSIHEKFICDDFQLALLIASYRRTGRKIVLTNGCFDILHRGHVAYLNRAKALGDILIVGLNSDESIRKIKGSDRPINSLEDRAQILAALSCVDYTVSFDNETPHELIQKIRPDVFVKGGDYTRATLPEANLVEQLGGRVEILPYLENYSTTSVIEKLRTLSSKSSEEKP